MKNKNVFSGMLPDFDKNLRYALENIISGKGKISSENLIGTITGYLRGIQGTSKEVESYKSAKENES